MDMTQDDIREQARRTAAMRTNGDVGRTTSQRGAGLSQLGTGLKICEQTELGWDTEMGWRNVTHAINELPVCLPKWWLRENALGHRHLGRITNPLHSAPAAVCYSSKMSSLWLGGRVLS